MMLDWDRAFGWSDGIRWAFLQFLVCPRCGALVKESNKDLHARWHRDEEEK